MSARKRQKTGGDVVPETENPEPVDLTPDQIFLKHLKSVMSNNSAITKLLIRDVSSEQNGKRSVKTTFNPMLTTEQYNTLRYVLITRKRSKALKTAELFATLDQPKSRRWFNTSTGDSIIFGIPNEIKEIKEKKTIPEQYDALFALTYMLNKYDRWLHDNQVWEEGGELDQAITLLSEAWTELYGKSNTELGIDAEFTRPGTEALLTELAEKLEKCEYDWYEEAALTWE